MHQCKTLREHRRQDALPSSDRCKEGVPSTICMEGIADNSGLAFLQAAMIL